MKTDKELLELAAKAAGYSTVWGVGDPLNDDGHAFLLAIKLNIASAFDVNPSLDALFAAAGVGLPRGVSEQVINGDKEAAARRAIVRAAAAIGESK